MCGPPPWGRVGRKWWKIWLKLGLYLESRSCFSQIILYILGILDLFHGINYSTFRLTADRWPLTLRTLRISSNGKTQYCTSNELPYCQNFWLKIFKTILSHFHEKYCYILYQLPLYLQNCVPIHFVLALALFHFPYLLQWWNCWPLPVFQSGINLGCLRTQLWSFDLRIKRA